jgi:hypothetical protein
MFALTYEVYDRDSPLAEHRRGWSRGPRFEPDTLKVYAALRVGFKEELEKYFHQGR